MSSRNPRPSNAKHTPSGDSQVFYTVLVLYLANWLKFSIFLLYVKIINHSKIDWLYIYLGWWNYGPMEIYALDAREAANVRKVRYFTADFYSVSSHNFH